MEIIKPKKVKLFYREYGKGKPVIIAHGLFGMSDNWVRIAKLLSKKFKVYVLDMRNHGQSPHNESHTYKEMANDLYEFIENLGIKSAIFIGHSMGGKAIMQFANKYPECVEKMIIVDISPKAYLHDDSFVKKTINHKKLLGILQKSNLNNFKNRKDIKNYFSKYFINIFIIQLIQKNIDRNKNGNFKWKINVNVVLSNLNELTKQISISEKAKNVTCLFIFGEDSPYFKKEDDEKFILRLFNKSEIKIVKNAGHLIHIEKEKEFVLEVLNFIK